MKLRFGTGCTLIALVLSPSLAFADAGNDVPRPPEAERASAVDTITLRSGAVLRGRVIEIVGGDHVSMILPTGETWRVPWSAVERLVIASTTFPPPPPPAAPAAAAGAAAPAPMVGPRVRVHIKSTGPAYLYRRAAGTTDFVTACEAPCDAEMPLGDSYKIGGSGITTKEFCLKGSPDSDVELTVDGASWFGVVAGSLLVTGGLFSSYVGLVVSLAGLGDERLLGPGLGCLAIGAAGLALGFYTVNRSMATDLTQKKLSPGPDAFVRAPSWRAAGPGDALRPPPAVAPWLFERRF